MQSVQSIFEKFKKLYLFIQIKSQAKFGDDKRSKNHIYLDLYINEII